MSGYFYVIGGANYEKNEIASPDGISIKKRGDFTFIMNFADEEKTVTLDKEYFNVIDEKSVSGDVKLPVCGYMIIK